MEHYVFLFLFVFLLLSKVYLMPEYHWRILICKFLPSSAYAITYFLTICSLFESKRFLLIPIINTCSHLFCYYLQHMFLASFNNALGQNKQIKNLSFNAFPGYCLHCLNLKHMVFCRLSKQFITACGQTLKSETN